MKRCWLLLERFKEQPRRHQRAAESALSRSADKYTKKSVAHFCNALFCAQFFDYLFLQRFILCAIFLIVYFDFGYVFLYI